MTSSTTQERARNVWLAWLILSLRSIDRMTAKASAVLLERVTDILIAGLVVAFTSVIALYVYSTHNGTMTAVAILGLGFCWFAALDQLNTSQVATLGQMLFLSVLVPVGLIAYGSGARPAQMLQIAVVELAPVFWAAIALFAAALLANALVKGSIRIGWAGIKRLRHDQSADVDPLEDGIQKGVGL